MINNLLNCGFISIDNRVMVYRKQGLNQYWLQFRNSANINVFLVTA